MQEFREFIMKGNIIDMAVGVIMGGAFGKIVTSLVDNILMPLIGVLSGGVNVEDLMWEGRRFCMEFSSRMSLIF